MQLKINAWGVKGARGSHSDLINLRASAFALKNLLTAESAYVQNIVDPTTSYADQDAFILTSGFSTKNSPTPQGVLSAPQNLHQVFNGNVSIYIPKLRWKKPLGLTSPNNVKFYQILRYPSIGPTLPAVIATSTKTAFTDNTGGLVKGTGYTYTVTACNDSGASPFCSPIAVTIPL